MVADDGEDVVLEIFHAGGGDLDDEIVVEAVDDQPGQEIGFAVDHAVVAIFGAQRPALAIGLADAPAQEIPVDDCVGVELSTRKAMVERGLT